MSSLFEQAQQMAGTELKKVRWALGISGVLSIALGALIIIWPGISLFALVIVFGAFTFARGVVGLATAFSTSMKAGRGWLIASSLASIAVGLVVFFWTDMSALALLYVVGAYAIGLGIITIGGAFWLPLSGGDSVGGCSRLLLHCCLPDQSGARHVISELGQGDRHGEAGRAGSLISRKWIPPDASARGSLQQR